jgi:hypothetical protein
MSNGLTSPTAATSDPIHSGTSEATSHLLRRATAACLSSAADRLAIPSFPPGLTAVAVAHSPRVNREQEMQTMTRRRSRPETSAR